MHHYYRGWNKKAEEEALLMFANILNNKEEKLIKDGIVATEANTLKHYKVLIRRSPFAK